MIFGSGRRAFNSTGEIERMGFVGCRTVSVMM